MIDKNMSMRKKKQDEVFLLAEGIIDGKVVATHEVRPARRPEKLLLWVDNENTDLKADGSDFVTVVAAIADEKRKYQTSEQLLCEIPCRRRRT